MISNDTQLEQLVESGFAVYKGMMSIRKTNHPRHADKPYMTTTTDTTSKQFHATFDDAIKHLQIFAVHKEDSNNATQ